MPKRRANGEGNIRKRKDGRWEGRYTVGHDPETGKAIIKNVLGKTQAEVKEKLKKAIEENVGIDYGRAKNYTVGNWLEVWYENYAKIKMRPSTYLTYHGYIENHIKPQFGKIPLNDLTTLHLQQFYKKLLAEGRVERIEAQKQPKGLSAKTVRNIHQIISSALKLAVEQRLIARNPADGCALPKAERKEMQTLPVEQLTSFLREAKDSGVFALYYIDLTTGLRRGELLGLKWSDIDLEKGDLRVQRQIGRIDGKIIEMPLKTKNAYRTLPLSVDAISVLKMQKCKVGNSEWVIPIAHRRPHVPGQRPTYATKSTETGRTATDTIPRPAPHLRDDGPAKRRGRENSQQYARSLLRGLYAGHLRPCDHRRADQSGANNGQYPLPCGIDLSATRSRWGQRLGQKKATP